MKYALVCLVDDANAQSIERSARSFAQANPPQGDILAPCPSHESVKQSVNGGNALVTGHNGGGNLRAASRGQPWANAAQFAGMFQGARVYVYACETLGSGGQESLASFGHEALLAGVARFAGHCVVVPTDNQASGLDGVVHALWRAFLEGEDDQEKLRGIGWRAFRSRQMHRPFQGGTTGGVLLAGALSAAIHGLRVLPAAGPPAQAH